MSDIYNKFNNINEHETMRDQLLKKRIKTNKDKFNAEKIERTLALSPYRDTLKYYEDSSAMTRVILNLLFLKPGTYPNSPEMGINIEQYKFEFLDSVTISEIERNINDQIQTYLSDSLIGFVELKKITEDVQLNKSLMISITVTTSKGPETTNYFL